MARGIVARGALAASSLLIGSPLFLASGCHRAFYREQADDQVAELIEEKSNDPRWARPGFAIVMDPRSRYFDPYDKDFPPMPPDDPASHEYMHCVYGMKGYGKWHDHGHIDNLENPGWRERIGEYAAITPEGRIKLRLEDSVQVALIHSPDFQEELETLYLSALDVSTERFRFDTQFFGGVLPGYDYGGPGSPGGENSTLSLDSDFNASRQFATAGELLVGFANSMTWEFAGDNQEFTSSLLNFSLVQPLLRAGGRVVALEQLTIAERALLSNLRAMERFRHGFYTNIAIGNNGTQGPQRRGGFFGGTGLTGFTGQGSGGFGGVGGATGFGGGFGGAGGGAGAGGAGFAGGGAGTVGGYIGLLQQLQQIRNTDANLQALLRTLALLEANLDAGLIDIAQVDQFRQNIETERANLLQAQNNLQNALDSFKRDTLGLPPNLEVDLDDSFIQQFQLIVPEVTQVQADISDTVDAFGSLPLDASVEDIRGTLERCETLRQEIARQLEAIPQDLARFDAALTERMQGLSETEKRLLQADRDRLDESLALLTQRLGVVSSVLEQLNGGLTPETTGETSDAVVELLSELSKILGEASLVQARARLESISVQPVHLISEDALEIARANRLDWMNNRAALVDTWRLIEFNANALQSDLTIRFSGDVGTNGDNPFGFNSQTGTVRASAQFDPPFTRLVERNNFRQQLIQYQQNRRQLIQFEDGVNQTLRQTLRSLEQLRVNLEIQRRAVAIAIRRVDQTREALNQPVPPPLPGAAPQSLGPTAAQNLLLALSDLRNAQNNLMSVWLNYHAGRMTLYRELGVMAIDENGLWIDQPLFGVERASAVDMPLPPPVDPRWLDALPPTEGATDGLPTPEGVDPNPAGPKLPGASADCPYEPDGTSTVRQAGWLTRAFPGGDDAPADPLADPPAKGTAAASARLPEAASPGGVSRQPAVPQATPRYVAPRETLRPRAAHFEVVAPPPER